MFGGCECGYPNCSVCGRHIEASRIRQRKKDKEEIISRKKMRKQCEKTLMPFGKHKGEKISELEERYCYWLLYYQRAMLPKDLVSLLDFRAMHYVPSRKSYIAYDYDEEKDMDYAMGIDPWDV